MRKNLLFVSLMAFPCAPGCSPSIESSRTSASEQTVGAQVEKNFPPSTTATQTRKSESAAPTIPDSLACLARLYGGEAKLQDSYWTLTPDGRKPLIFDDGKPKSIEEKLVSPDLEDTLAAPYTAGVALEHERRTNDPGRIRHLQFLSDVYGGSRKEIEAQLLSISFLGYQLQVHRLAEPAFHRVAKRIRELGHLTPEERRVLENLGGGFNYRKIQGTDRLSPHSFGIAIDLNPTQAAYFRWSSQWDGIYPSRIVEAFESEGFIWGGRWRHFDSMHFEYRPELFPERCSTAYQVKHAGLK